MKLQLARLDPDRLDVEIFFEVLLAGLAAIAAHFVPPNGTAGSMA
jgi:hypothetical protein